MKNNEKKETTIKVKKKIVGPASYVSSNISFINGKAVYEKSYKTVADEENDLIVKKYAAKLREQQKSQEKEKVSSSLKRNTLTSTEEHNLFKKLNITDDDKNILLDVIKYSLTEREQKLLKAYFGYSYDGYYRQSTSGEERKNVNVIVKKLRTYLKQAKDVLSDHVFKYRVYLLSFKNELEYVDPNIFENVSKPNLKQAYKKLNEEEVRIAKIYFNFSTEEDLNDEELILFTKEIVPKMKLYIFEPKGIDVYCKAYTNNEQKVFRDCIGVLSDADLVIVKKKFGPKLDGKDRKELTPQENSRFQKTISPKLQKKYEELLSCSNTTDYYLSLIKGFSNLDIEKRCNIEDEIDKKILLDILEILSENDKNILFTTNQIGKKTRIEVATERARIIKFIKNNIIKLKKVYYLKDEYSKQLESLFNNTSLASKKSTTINISLKKYLELGSASILQDVINYGLKENEQQFLQDLFANDYEKETFITEKNLKKQFNNIDIRLNSLVNYLKFLTKEEYDEFILDLKNFSKENEYNGYYEKDLSTALNLPFDETLNFVIKYGLNASEKKLLQKRFGLTYEGFFAKKITSKEKYYINIIKEKIKTLYSLLKENSNLETTEKEKILQDFVDSKNEQNDISLAEYLKLKENEIIQLPNALKTLQENEINILYKKFGINLDGKNRKIMTKEENYAITTKIKQKLLYSIDILINTDGKDLNATIDRLMSHHKFHYKYLSLYEALQLSKEYGSILIETINKLFSDEEIILLKKRFGPLYDGVGIVGVTKEENEIINFSYIPKLEVKLNNILEPTTINYRIKSLLEYLGLAKDNQDKLIIVINNLYNNEEIALLQRRFGPLYDGKDAVKVSSEENTTILTLLLPRLKSKIKGNNKEKKYFKIKTLKEFLGLTEDEEIKQDLAIKTLTQKEIEILKKVFGPLYDGENREEITQKEKIALNKTIKPKLLRVFKVINETDEKDLDKELNKVTSKNKFGYRLLSLYDCISLSLDDKEILINAINKLFSEEIIVLLKKRFGPLYDGVDIVGVTKEENKLINFNYIPLLKNEINKKLGIKTELKGRYHKKSLFKYLNIKDEQKNILLDIINIFSMEDKELLQRRFGPKYDGENTEEISISEKNRIFGTVIPKTKDMFLILSKTPKEEYRKVLKDLAFKYRNRRKKLHSTLTRAMSIAEFDQEQQALPKAKAFPKKVINVEEVKVVEKATPSKEISKEESTRKYDEYFVYISQLLHILEEEKGIFQTNISLEELKYGLNGYSKSLELCSLGFTKKEALFLILGTREGLNLSIKEVTSYLALSEENLKTLYLDCTNKIRTIIGAELDSYISLLKEKSDSNEC